MSISINDRLRLNPFSFPTDTSLRFLILVGFVIAASGNLYADFWSSFLATKAAAASECNAVEISRIFRTLQSESASFSFLSKVAPEIATCAHKLRSRGVFEIFGILATLAITIVIYSIIPRLLLWKLRLENITASEVPGLYQEFYGLCAKAALPAIPTLVWNPASENMPIVFGRRNRYYVALSGGFVANYLFDDVASFRAIILHELAHVRNGDIHRTYLTVSASMAFLLISVAPTPIVFLFLEYDRTLIFDIIFSAILIALAGLAVLRAREYYADIRASMWDGTLVNIRQALTRSELARTENGGATWPRYLRSHPEPNERIEIVEDTSRLFPLSMGVALGLGLVAWQIDAALITLIFPFLPADPFTFLIFVLSLGMLAEILLLSFVVGAVGIGIWRATFASLVTNRKLSSDAGRVGIAVGASYLVYILFDLLQILLSHKGSAISVFFNFFVMQLVVSIVLAVGCFIIFRWIASATSGWLEVTLTSRSPTAILMLTVGIALVLVTGTLFGSMFITAGQLLTALPGVGSAAEWYVMLGGSTIFLGLMIAWAFPFAGYIWKKRNSPMIPPSWVFLENSRAELPSQDPLRLRSALVVGVGTGIIGCLPWALIYFYHYLPAGFATWVTLSARWLRTLAQGLGGTFDALIPTAVFQALAAAIAAARANRLNALCGLFAASISGCIMSIGIYFMLHIAGGLLWSIGAFTSLGALIALPAATLAGWLRRGFLESRMPVAGPSGAPPTS